MTNSTYPRIVSLWLCLCPLLAAAVLWQVALALAVGLALCVVATAGAIAMLRSSAHGPLRLPLAALVAGTLAVLEHLVLATWWPVLDVAVAPWLVLVAGLAVLVCMGQKPIPGPGSRPIHVRDDEGNFLRDAKHALALSAALLIIGVARDGFGRVFLLAETPVGALVLLALLLAAINLVMRGTTGSSHISALSPLDSGLRRNGEQPRSATGLRGNDVRNTSSPMVGADGP